MMNIIDLTQEDDDDMRRGKRARPAATYVATPKKLKREEKEEEEDIEQNEDDVRDLLEALLAAQMTPVHNPVRMTPDYLGWVFKLYTPDLEIGRNEGGDVFVQHGERIMAEVDALACW
jgi:hypothetical protein